MPHYFARVELIGDLPNDYHKLHDTMAKCGYYRVIQLKDGKWYDLPGQLYYKNSVEQINKERYDVEDAILQIVTRNETGFKQYSLVLTASFTKDICLKLIPCLDPNKLPPNEIL